MRFKSIFVFLFLVIANLDLFAQYSGKVTYRDSYESKNSNVSSSEFEKFVGSKRELYIQGSFYKIINYGEITSFTLYRGDENRIYFFTVGTDTVYWTDCKTGIEQRQENVKILPSNETILSLKCDKLTLSSSGVSTTYFFNSAFQINPKDFSSHSLESWDLYTAIAKAVPLKIIVNSDELILTSTAMKIEQMKVPDKVFDVPKGYLKKQ